MKILIIFTLVVSHLSADIIYNKENTKIHQFLNILKGIRASEGQFPYIVKLRITQTNGHTGCGGALIGKNWILTAAHCVRDVVKVKVYLGTIKRRSAKVTRTVNASYVYPHELYQRSSYGINDIALIYIPTIAYTKQIKAIKLPSIVPPYPDYAGSYGTVSGWGKTNNHSEQKEKFLRYANVPIMSNLACVKFYRKLRVYNICIDTSKSNTCRGDSGGPLAINSGGLLVGINSYGKGGCVLRKPGVFMRITSYLQWIKKKTGISY